MSHILSSYKDNITEEQMKDKCHPYDVGACTSVMPLGLFQGANISDCNTNNTATHLTIVLTQNSTFLISLLWIL